MGVDRTRAEGQAKGRAYNKDRSREGVGGQRAGIRVCSLPRAP